MSNAPIDEQMVVPEEQGSAIRDLLSVVRTRFWTILACVVVVFTIFAVRTFRATPVYEATAKLHIERSTPQVALTQTTQSQWQWWNDEKRQQTMINLVTSKAVLEKALEDERLAPLFEERDGLPVPRPGLFRSIVSEIKVLFGGQSSRPAEPWERLRGLVSAKGVEETNLVTITARHTDPGRAALVANVVARAFVDHRIATRKTTAEETFEMLQKQKGEQQKALAESEDELEQFRGESSMPQLGVGPELETPISDRLKRLTDQYTSIQMLRLEHGVAARAVDKALEGGADVDALLGIRAVRSDPAIDSLENQLAEVKLEIQSAKRAAASGDSARVPKAVRDALDGKVDVDALLSIPAIASDRDVGAAQTRLTENDLAIQAARKTYGPKHPKVAMLKERKAYLQAEYEKCVRQAAEADAWRRGQQIADLEDRRDLLRTRLRETAVRVGQAVQAEYEQLVAREEKIEQALKGQNQLALELAKKSHRYRRLKRNVDRQTRLFSIILDRMKEVDLTKDTGATNVSLSERAETPQHFVSPNRKRALIAGGMLGLMLGLGLAYLLEHLDDTVKVPEEVEQQLGMASLGYVPRIVPGDGSPNGFPGRASYTMHNNSGSATEAFRSIRTNVYFSGELGQMKSVHVTSPAPGEGKTILATNLAITLAREGRRVLLVDADLRRPMIDDAFGLEKEPGLTNLLVEGEKLEDLVKTVPDADNEEVRENLHVLCAGRKTPNPAELLGGEAMAAFMKDAAERYDAVIYDSCPVPFLADNAPLSVNSSGTILVLRSGATRRDAARRARKQLQTVKGNLIGAVVNEVRPKTLKGYRYRYQYYYHYHQYYNQYQGDGERGTDR
ncbi:MAG: GumC family protein [Planctomycetota bacterium]